MNAKNCLHNRHLNKKHVLSAAALTCAFAALPVYAVNVEWWTDTVTGANTIVDPFVDPLLAAPPVLASGPVLPGNSPPPSCPAIKYFLEPLTLAEAVDFALCTNPQVKMAWAGIKVQAAAVGEARAAYLPTLSVSSGRLRTTTINDNPAVDSTMNYGNTVNAKFGWRLFDFGGRAANRALANSLLVASMARHDAAMQKALSTVIEAYFNAQTAQAASQAKDQNETLALRTLESAKRREAGGAISRSDTLQAATAAAKAGLEKNRARGEYRKALAVLVYAMGVPSDTQIILADDLRDNDGREIQAQQAKNLREWLDLTQQSHPEIVAARSDWEASQKKVIATRAEGLPTLDFSADHYKNGFPNQGLSSASLNQNTIGISLTIPLFEGFARTYKVRGAQALAEQKARQLEDTEQSVLMGVIKAHADAQATLGNLDAAEQLLRSAQESLQASQRRYDRGAADIVELLSAQAALSDAQQEHVRSRAEWRSAKLKLLASAGTLGRIPTEQ